jgi:hypothetical protein
MTADECLASAKRLLEFAELETDLAKMKAYNDLADSWISVAAALMERERV